MKKAGAVTKTIGGSTRENQTRRGGGAKGGGRQKRRPKIHHKSWSHPKNCEILLKHEGQERGISIGWENLKKDQRRVRSALLRVSLSLI